MPSILVTGGAGYIGSHTVVELFRADYKPVIIDNFSNSEKSVLKGIKAITGETISLYAGDCNDEQFVKHVFESEPEITGCIHFAAYKAVGESVEKPVQYYKNNINSLLELLSAMLKFNIKNLVFSSSCTVYGQPDDLPVTESSPVKKAESPYGNTKQICEEIIKDTVDATGKIKAVSLRYFNPVGAHPTSQIGELPIGTPNNLIPFLTQTVAGIREELIIFGDDYNTPDGTCVRDYIHVVDLAKAHVKALDYLEKEKNDSVYQVFNVGTGNGHTVLDVIKTFELATGEKVKYRIGIRRPGDIEKVWANADKIYEELNWKAERTLKQALYDAWNWQKVLKSRGK